MKGKYRASSFLQLTVAMSSLLWFFVACSAQQIKMSPTMAVLNTSAFSPNGKLIAAGRDIFNVVLLYDGSTASFKKALVGETNKPNEVAARSLSFSRDSRYLAAAGIDDMVVVWDLSTEQIKIRFPNLKGALSLCFSPITNVLAVSGPGNSITLWNIPEGSQIGELTGHSAPIMAMAFSPDGKMLATGSADKTARLWSVEGLQQIRVFDGHSYSVHSVSFSPDGSTLAAYAGFLHIWRWGNGEENKVPHPPIPMAPPYSLLDRVKKNVSERMPAIFSPDGNTLAILGYLDLLNLSGTHDIVLLDMPTNTVNRITCNCLSISYSPDGTKLAAVGSFGVSESVRLLDPFTGKWIQTYKER